MNNKGQVGYGITALIIIVLIVLVVVIMFVFVSALNQENVDKVVMPQSIVTHLNNLYEESTNEFVLCLSGHIENDVATITSYRIPEEIIAVENDITFVRCEDTLFDFFGQERHLGTIHNHQVGICHPSYLDSYTFGKLGDDILGIICGVDNIHFFTPKNLIKSIELEVG